MGHGVFGDILLVLQYQVSTTVMDSVVVFALFVFMLALLCFCVATVFAVNKHLYFCSNDSNRTSLTVANRRTRNDSC